MLDPHLADILEMAVWITARQSFKHSLLPRRTAQCRFMGRGGEERGEKRREEKGRREREKAVTASLSPHFLLG